MNRPREATQRSGIGFLGALTLLFIGLKLTGHIDWSWWLVLAPMFVGLGLVLVAVGIAIVFATLVFKEIDRN